MKATQPRSRSHPFPKSEKNKGSKQKDGAPSLEERMATVIIQVNETGSKGSATNRREVLEGIQKDHKKYWREEAAAKKAATTSSKIRLPNFTKK